MPLIRGTFFFTNADGAGWTETLFINVANLTLALAEAQDLVPLRVALLGQQSALVNVRVSDDFIKRDSQIFPVPPGDQTPARGVGSEHASDDLVIRLEGGVVFRTRRTLAMRGIPTNIIGSAGRFIGDPGGWNSAFTVWTQQLIQRHWAIKFRDKTVPVFNLAGAVQDVTTGIVTVTTAVAHGYLSGDLVMISRVIGAVEINGIWVIASATATTFTFKLQALMRPYILSGQVNKQNFALAEINKVLIIRSNTHRAGRPFGQLVGRRKVRRR